MTARQTILTAVALAVMASTAGAADDILIADGGPAELVSLEVYELQSAWE